MVSSSQVANPKSARSIPASVGERRSIAVLTLLFLSLLLTASFSGATTYSVKASGGGNYTTISACVSAMSSNGGDTCVVYAGAYAEKPSIKAGTAGNYNVLTANPGDKVTIQAATVNSHTKLSGFTITNPSAPASGACVAFASGSTDIYVTGNVMTACGDGGAMIKMPVNTTGITYAYIQNNTLSYACSTSSAPNVCEGMIINGSYILVEGNDISHVSDGITNLANHAIFRKNNFHDMTTSDCGSYSSNCHIDAIESEPVSGTSTVANLTLYEGNTVLRNLGANSHAFLTQGDACKGQCYDTIMRFNNMAHVGTFGVLDDNSGNSSVSPGYYKVKIYNNNFIDFLQAGGQMAVNGHQNNSIGGAEINNLFYFPNSVTNLSPYYVDSSSSSGFTAGGNLAWCGGTCSFMNKANNGTFTTDATGNLFTDPKFTNYSTNDFTLSSGSPATGAGVNLTTATTGGTNSTTLTVADASFFQDGWGLPSGTGLGKVSADTLRIGTSTVVKIASINYSTNTITLATPVSWSSGAPVYLYALSDGTVVLNGAKPDIGALTAGVSSVPFNVTTQAK